MLDSLKTSDADAAAALSAGFGWPHRVEDWAMALALGRGVAWREGGALLGTAMMFARGAAHGTIGLVQVAPALQGRGIGKRLMEAAIALGEGRNLKLHATAAGAGLYARLGFRACGVVQQWQGVTPLMGEPFQTAGEAVFDTLCAFDLAATGVDRRGLLRVLFDAGAVRVNGEDGAISGYAMRRMFGQGMVIGPVIAGSEAVAVGLVGSLLQPGFMRVDIPAERVGLAQALAGAGLTSVEDVAVMVRGVWPEAPGFYGLSSQAMG